MAGTIKKLLIGVSMVAGMSAIASAPASAFNLSGSDVLKFSATDTNNDGLLDTTQVDPNANLNTLLQGTSSSPGGNIELFASSESVTLQQFLASNARTSITGTVAGKDLTVSSLTAADWFGPSLNIAYSANTFATTWFNAFYDNAGLASSENSIKTGMYLKTGDKSWLTKTSAQIREVAYNNFLSDQVKGFQRSSDPNISYITTSGSDLLIGLAGHYDAKAFYAPILGSYGQFIKDGFQVSEVVKVKYGDTEKLLYSFSASKSGLVNAAGVGADGKSHSGNYEVSLTGVVPPPQKSVPEPSTMLALIGVGGFMASKRKMLKKA